jgi:hypothetical protein
MYIDPDKIKEKLKDIPQPLRQKALNELDEIYKSRGFKARANGQDSIGHWVDVDIKPGTELVQVYEFLQSANIAAVTVEPVDIERLYGKNAGTLAMRRAIEINGAASQGLELIEPDDLADAFTNAGSMGISWDGFVADEAAAEKFITDDLISNGLLSESDAKSDDQWMEAKPEPMGLRIGERGEYEDMGEFAPDYSEEEWGEEL